MKREILFRGKRTDNGEWVEGNLMTYLDESCCIGVDTMKAYLRYAVDPTTVGQYTGLTDKNGVKIFEGGVVNSDLYGRLIIKWDKTTCGFYALNPEDYQIYLVSSDYEVIGNIHDE